MSRADRTVYVGNVKYVRPHSWFERIITNPHNNYRLRKTPFLVSWALLISLFLAFVIPTTPAPGVENALLWVFFITLYLTARYFISWKYLYPRRSGQAPQWTDEPTDRTPEQIKMANKISVADRIALTLNPEWFGPIIEKKQERLAEAESMMRMRMTADDTPDDRFRDFMNEQNISYQDMAMIGERQLQKMKM